MTDPGGVMPERADAGDALPGQADAVIVGRSLPGLLTALDLAEVGLQVVVTGERPENLDGPVRDPEGVLAAVLARVAEPLDASTGANADSGSAPKALVSAAPWLIDREGRWAPQAEPSVLGIPAVPLAERTIRLLGGGAAMRAYLDRVTPLLTIGKTRALGRLVGRRLGASALARLCEPVVHERFGVAAAEVDVAIAAPGLNEALSRAGSLTSAALAYSERNVARETEVEPEGGWSHLRRALERRLAAYGVDLVESPVTHLAEGDGNTWSVSLTDGRCLTSRSLVLDPGEAPDSWEEASPLWTIVSDLIPPRMRVYAESEIHEDTGLPPGASGVRLEGTWSVRVERSASRRTSVRLSGPAVSNALLDAYDDGDPSLFDAVLTALALHREDDSAWRVRRAAAPFATVGHRDAVRAATEGLREKHPTLLPIGTALHGDDLAAAIAAAEFATVELRRQLLGLADAE